MIKYEKGPLCNCAPCHFPCVNIQVVSSLAIVPTCLQCMLYGKSQGVATMSVYDH
jgi:hypothetical protein